MYKFNLNLTGRTAAERKNRLDSKRSKKTVKKKKNHAIRNKKKLNHN